VVFWHTIEDSPTPDVPYRDFLFATPVAKSGTLLPTTIVQADDNFLRMAATWADGRWNLIWDGNPFLPLPGDLGGARFGRFSKEFDRLGALGEVSYPASAGNATFALERLASGFAWLSTGLTSTGKVTPSLSILRSDGSRRVPDHVVSERVGEDALVVSESLAVAPDGRRAVVVYNGGDRGPGGKFDVFARQFGSLGEPLGPSHRLNQTLPGIQWLPRIATTPSGYWVVWEQRVADGVAAGVFARRLDAGGRPWGPPIRVDQGLVADSDLRPAIAADENGNFLVVWQSFNGLTAARWDVKARFFSESGHAKGPPIVVNQARKNDQLLPYVAYSGQGIFLVGWNGSGQFGTGSEEDVFIRQVGTTPP
jgi:hypothetical protein